MYSSHEHEDDHGAGQPFCPRNHNGQTLVTAADRGRSHVLVSVGVTRVYLGALG